MLIDATGLSHRALNEEIRLSNGECEISDCLGQRFIGAGMSEVNIKIGGVPGNALGAYLNGGTIDVMGSAQDAVGDTMNAGRIIVRGSIGDAAGYAMRGGSIFINKNAGYRAGIHMKEYRDKVPLMIIGGRAGSFLGEYQAGGIIIVLNLYEPDLPIVGEFPCTGMHGGRMYLRSGCQDIIFPKQVNAKRADENDINEISAHIQEFCKIMGHDAQKVLSADFVKITPAQNNPYRQMYAAN